MDSVYQKAKIELGRNEVKWLGYKISAAGIQPDPEKTEHEKTI